MTTPNPRFPGVSRRAMLVGGLAAVGAAVAGCSQEHAGQRPAQDPGLPFSELERSFGGRLGVCAIDTGSGVSIGHREDQRSLMCSTVKVFIVSAVLDRRLSVPGLLDKRVRYTQSDILEWAPITHGHVADGMTVGQLCEAAVSYSDSTAANLLITQLGGPGETEKFLRALGDNTTNTDRAEPELDNPDGDKDTSTPRQLASNLRALILGNRLDAEGRGMLTGWMKANTTGEQSIRAGVPRGWVVGDKTGTGFSGESNDIAVIWPPNREPIVLAVLAVPDDPKSSQGKPAIAEATRRALRALGV